jgi:Transposase DDE domain
MHHRLLTILSRCTQDLAELLQPHTIRQLCEQLGYQYRCRVLDPVTTIHLLILQILHGNTALGHVPLLARIRFSASALCQARARLPLQLFEGLLRRGLSTLTPQIDSQGRWLGHRTFLIDGSSFSMPDTPELQAHFGQSRRCRPGCGFPVAHLMGLFHAGTGLLLEVLAAPLHSHDLPLARQLDACLAPGDVLVGDRAYDSFAYLALAVQRGLHAVIRHRQVRRIDRPWRCVHQVQRPPKAPAWISQIVQVRHLSQQKAVWLKPQARCHWLSPQSWASLPARLEVRLVRYRVSARGFRSQPITVATTLLDETRYPAEAIAQLYGQRWRIEVWFRDLKQTLKLKVLHCRSVAGVTKELSIIALVYNLVRAVLGAAAGSQKIALERWSFVALLRWLACAAVDVPLGAWALHPIRPGRWEPRAIKRRARGYPWLTKPRRILRNQKLRKPLPP